MVLLLGINVYATPSKMWFSIVSVSLFGLGVGGLFAINSWDYPTYMIIGAAAVFASNYFRYLTISASMALRSIFHFVVVLLIGYVVFIPFHSNYQSFFSNLEATTNTTILWQFLSINGLFIFILGSFYVNELRCVFASINSANFDQHNTFRNYLSRLNRNLNFIKYLWILLILLIIGALSYGLVINTGSTVPFLLGMTLIVFGVGIAKIMKREQSYRSATSSR